MSLLGTVQRGRVGTRPLRMLVYGVPGVGKSTFAAGATEPLFLDAEQGTLGLDVARLPIGCWADFGRAIHELRTTQHGYRTVVLDTLDALDRMLVTQVTGDAGVGSIEDVGGGFSKGWNQVAERWGRMLEELEGLQATKRVNLIALAHANIESFNDPTGADYKRWALRLPKKSSGVWVGWVEELLFATRDVQSGRKDKGKGRGGERVLYTKWAPGRECKNRRDLPERLPLEWSALATALRRGAEQAKPTRDEDDTSMRDVDEAPPVPAVPAATAEQLVVEVAALKAKAPAAWHKAIQADVDKAAKLNDAPWLRTIIDQLTANLRDAGIDVTAKAPANGTREPAYPRPADPPPASKSAAPPAAASGASATSRATAASPTAREPGADEDELPSLDGEG